MGVTFFIATRVDDDYLLPAYSCGCDTSLMIALECHEGDEPFDFSVYRCELCTDVSIAVSNVNAMELCRWWGIPAELMGEVLARDLAAACRRRLWPEERNEDPGVPPSQRSSRVYDCGRRPGYLKERTQEMLRICEKAGDRWIAWA